MKLFLLNVRRCQVVASSSVIILGATGHACTARVCALGFSAMRYTRHAPLLHRKRATFVTPRVRERAACRDGSGACPRRACSLFVFFMPVSVDCTSRVSNLNLLQDMS